MRAISVFSLEAGISTFWCRAIIALRIRVSMSATGSVNLIVLLLLSRPFAFGRAAGRPKNPRRLVFAKPREPKPRLVERHPLLFLYYQDDFETPGISPRNAKPRKHRRQSPNLRR